MSTQQASFVPVSHLAHNRTDSTTELSLKQKQGMLKACFHQISALPLTHSFTHHHGLESALSTLPLWRVPEALDAMPNPSPSQAKSKSTAHIPHDAVRTRVPIPHGSNASLLLVASSPLVSRLSTASRLGIVVFTCCRALRSQQCWAGLSRAELSRCRSSFACAAFVAQGEPDTELSRLDALVAHAIEGKPHKTAPVDYHQQTDCRAALVAACPGGDGCSKLRTCAAQQSSVDRCASLLDHSGASQM